MYFTIMKQLLLALALLLSLVAGAQQEQNGVFFFKKDSLPYQVRTKWHFHMGDSVAWAGPGFNDTGWEMVNPSLRMKVHPLKVIDSFNGIAWLRLTFFIDTALVNVPLALTMTQ